MDRFYLGGHTFPVTTSSAAAQCAFDRGLTLAYGFAHQAAEQEFRRAGEIDPDCAMVWWGVALVNGPHINFPVVPRDKAATAWAALTRARALADQGTPLEKALMDALAARYSSPQPGDRSLLDAAYAAAMRQVWHACPQNADENLFARNIRVLRLELNAWLAHVEGQEESSVALMREAADLEASTPKHAATPGPTFPADELLGDLIMELKQPAKARVAYQRSLELYPGRFNSPLGAAQAARAFGDESSARLFYKQLLEIADGGTRQSALLEAHNFVDP